MDLKYVCQQYFTCMCFLGFIRYNKTFIACEYTFIACWWGKYENLFTQEYHISLGQHQTGIWYSWVNTFSYFLNSHAINVLLYRMKPRKHIHVKYCPPLRKPRGFFPQSYRSLTGKRQRHSERIIWPLQCCCGGKNPRGFRRGGIWYLFHGIWFLSCVITCPDFYPLSYQINLCFGIIKHV
jgi:hypothetical protein